MYYYHGARDLPLRRRSGSHKKNRINWPGGGPLGIEYWRWPRGGPLGIEYWRWPGGGPLGIEYWRWPGGGPMGIEYWRLRQSSRTFRKLLLFL